LPAVDSGTNRFSADQGYLYDKNGNITHDPETNDRQFIFNGDNKQVQVKSANGDPIGTYFYDGEGKRIKKVSSTETTVFVYDATGKLIAEYSNQVSPNPTISYTATDPLGSPRAITDKQGNIISRRDFMPFGEELSVGVGNRTEANKYGFGDDNIRKRFTGYEKDQETGLDFAEARYYNNPHGRFTAVDPLLASGKSANPQTFNRYVYVLNNPLVLTDPEGLQVNWSGRTYANSDYTKFANYRKEGFTRYQGDPREYDGEDGFRYRVSQYSSPISSLGNLGSFLRPRKCSNRTG
jgi:RHS repeat-associated protein